MSKQRKTFESPFVVYSEIGILGEGGAGRVYEVEDLDSGERLALKVLIPEQLTSDKIKRFRNELAFCEREIHPRILRILDYGYDRDDSSKVPFYVMRKYSHTLRKHMKQGIRREVILEVFAKILDGVEAAHLIDVWHRDIKPENILSTEDPRDLVVADFGIAHFTRDVLIESVKTSDGARLCNFTYAAPEQRQRGASVDHRADIYALGLILNELFTTKIPLGADYVKIRDVALEFEWLDPIVDKMLKQDPSKRFQHIDEIKLELIGRKQEFVERQKLMDAKKKIVAPASSPPSFDDVTVVGLDYNEGRLHFILSSSPGPSWLKCFKHNPGSRSMIMGSEPEMFTLSGNNLSVPVDGNSAPQVKNLASTYIQQANETFRNALAADAAQRERDLRDQQEARIEKEEQRLRVLAMLNK